jgi:RNA polymerase sigma factor (sigma-70 family)
VTERELVAAAAAGDPGAFAALVGRERPRVEAVVARMLPRDEVDDVVQDALLRAYLGLSRLRDADRFGSWLCGIAINVAKMRLRRLALQRRVAVGADPPASDERELLEVVRDAVDILPPGQREVVLMHYVDDLSCEEIARLLGTTPGAIRVRLHRARAQLRHELAPLTVIPRTTKEKTMIEMRLEDVIVRVSTEDETKLASEMRIVLLREAKGDRVVPMWIGAGEGDALAARLRDHAPPRPLTSDLMVELVRTLGGNVERVTVTALRDKTFYATVTVSGSDLDARPSDAINLAVRIGAPIHADEAVVDEAGRVLTNGLDEMLDGEIERFGGETAPGRWSSLSKELLAAIHPTPK